MIILLYSQATTTAKISAFLQAKNEPKSTLTLRYGSVVLIFF